MKNCNEVSSGFGTGRGENNQQAAVIYVVNRLYDQVDYLLNENGVSRTDYVSKTVVLERIERLLDINQIQAFCTIIS